MLFTRRIPLIRDFPSHPRCDRCILNLVRQHLMQHKGDSFNLQKEQQFLRQLKQIFEQLGVIIVTAKGEVQFITPRGKQLLNQYFDEVEESPGTYSIVAPRSFSVPPAILPKSLRHWVQNQISLPTSNSQVLCCCYPLQIEKKGKQLLIRLIGNLIGEQYLLLLEEQERRSFSIASLELLGLTNREAEVLFWVAKDKSNSAIAKRLGCAEGTIRKHLEHIHQKLGVQTRTAAVMVALEKLGLLNEQLVVLSS